MATQKTPAPEQTVIAYKGFDRGFACHPSGGERIQYEVGKTYEHKGAVKACKSGFHACEYPLHVLRYYAPGTSVFALVVINRWSPSGVNATWPGVWVNSGAAFGSRPRARCHRRIGTSRPPTRT